jgi:hypothetical protein
MSDCSVQIRLRRRYVTSAFAASAAGGVAGLGAGVVAGLVTGAVGT